MWLLNFHISVSVLCFLTILGFVKMFKENIIKNGWIEKEKLEIKRNFISKLKLFINTIFILFIPILNLLITFVVIFMCFIEKSTIEELKEFMNDK